VKRLLRAKGVGDKPRSSLMPELPAYSGALHPQESCWAWSGRSSRVDIRSIGGDPGDQEDGQTGRGPLGGEGGIVETGKGRFGMDLQFVSA
jgi:WD repeat-containing protein 61